MIVKIEKKRRELGQTLTEYCLLLAVVVLGVAFVIEGFSGGISSVYKNLTGKINASVVVVEDDKTDHDE